MTFHQRPFPKTHELGELSPDCLAIDSSLASTILEAEALTQYAWRFRYPGVPREPDAEEAIDARRKAEAVLREIERRISKGHLDSLSR